MRSYESNTNNIRKDKGDESFIIYVIVSKSVLERGFDSYNLSFILEGCFGKRAMLLNFVSSGKNMV